MKPVRTRFAPSPTGYLHVGGVRTALFAWLYAKHFKGHFILRIEDTDRERSTTESVGAILDGMAWLGLDAEEGPYYQSERMDRYQTVANSLLDEGKAYRCRCSHERLEQLRSAQMEAGEKPRYDGHCRELQHDASEPFVLRFKTPKSGEVVFQDLVYGEIHVANAELDDLVLVRQDGVPTYNFAVVIDDWDMDITHVIRGDDHINNTPRQINIYQALNASLPIFAHLPMILGPDGKRLSKRHGAVNVMSFKEEGYLPQALLNDLVRLGWSHGDQEIFSLEDMIRDFNLAHVSRSASAFDYDKLRWLNQHYLKTLPWEETLDEWLWQMHHQGLDIHQGPSWEKLQILQAPRHKTLKELVADSAYFYQDLSLNALELQPFRTPSLDAAIAELMQRFEALGSQDWQAAILMNIVKETAQRHELKMPQLGQPLRIILTGSLNAPSLDGILELLGVEKTRKRLASY
ncbi:MAG: glutamate--tRNA ligase [Gammaproteobacteria bacterium]|nr:glutamate--tRNA ligase [Gammaproteobacteria bacterium]